MWHEQKQFQSIASVPWCNEMAGHSVCMSSSFRAKVKRKAAPGEGYFLWWSVRSGFAAKGYLFQGGGIKKGKD